MRRIVTIKKQKRPQPTFHCVCSGVQNGSNLRPFQKTAMAEVLSSARRYASSQKASAFNTSRTFATSAVAQSDNSIPTVALNSKRLDSF